MRRTSAIRNTGLVIVLLALSTPLTGCGFIIAPAQHSVARVAQLSVKGADAGIAHGRKAAKVVSKAAISATQAAVDGLRPATVRSTQSGRQPPGPVSRGAPLQ
jgi:hypothetical protein